MPSRIVKVEVSKRGPQGAIDPQDRARFDRAVEVAEAVDAVVETVTQAEGTAAQAAEVAVQAAQTAAQDAAAAVAPAAADAIRAQVAEDADRAAQAAEALPSEVSARQSLIRPASVDGYAAVIMDSAKRATWLAARDTDGAPPDWVIDHLVDRMEAPLGVAGTAQGLAAEVTARESIARVQSAPGLAAAVMDRDKRLTWLAASETDGGMPAWVAQHVAERVAPHLNVSDASVLASDAWLRPDGTIGPVIPNMEAPSLWGDSISEIYGPFLQAELTPMGASLYLGAKWGERSEHIIARLGAKPARLTFPSNTIPASGSVTVTSSNLPASSWLKPFTGVISGVAGTVSSTDTTITFTRTTAGSAVTVDADLPFVPDAGPPYRGHAAIIKLGHNNLWMGAGAQRIIEDTDTAFAWFSALAKRVLVIGLYANTDVLPGDIRYTNVTLANAAMRARYGHLFWDIQAYLSSPQVWTDTGVTPTAADLEQQARGSMPQSLARAPGDTIHLSDHASRSVAKQIAQKLTDLGWYKEPVA